jgi:hypothetical protein
VKEDAEGVHVANLVAVVRAVRAEGKERGTMPCPECTDGTIHYAVAGNGHVRATCTTDKCLRLMT